MDAPTEKNKEKWLNRVFGVPEFPPDKRSHYPFSRGCPSFRYRLKVALLLLGAVGALWWMEHPCLRLSLLLNCWLLFLTCENLYRNYPWREPLNEWLWNFRLNVPYWGLLSTIGFVLPPLCWNTLGTGCKLPYPPLSGFVFWVCLMLAYPLIRDYCWQKAEKTVFDYDQFSFIRPRTLTWTRPIAALFATLQSPSLLIFGLVALATWILSWLLSFLTPLLPWWAAYAWTLFTRALTTALLAYIFCRQLPTEVRSTLGTWEAEEVDYARKIEEALNEVKTSLQKESPQEGSELFDRLAIQVPLLQREAAILRKESRTLDESRARALDQLTAVGEVVSFRKRLDTYGPYTDTCCVS